MTTISLLPLPPSIVFISIIILLLSSCQHLSASHLLPQLFSFRNHYYERCISLQFNCSIVEFQTPTITLTTLTDLLESPTFETQYHQPLREKYTHYFVVLNITVKSEDLYTAYKDIDTFITFRPWWIVRQYPREHVHGMLGIDVLPQMILERVPEKVEALGRVIIARDFPSAEECAKRPKYIKTTVGSWGNDIVVNQRSFFENFPTAVHQLYMTDTGSSSDKVGYVEHAQCMNKVDKHQCAFLVISNCSLPQSLSSCRDRSCIVEGVYVVNNDTSSASTSSHVYSKSGNEALQLVDFFKFFPRIYPNNIPDSPTYRMIDPTQPVTPNNTEHSRDSFEQIRDHYHTNHWMFNVLYKPNFLLGLQMQDMLQEFYTPAISHKASSLPVNQRKNNNHHHDNIDNDNNNNHNHNNNNNNNNHHIIAAHDLSQSVTGMGMGMGSTSFAHVPFERSLQVNTPCIAAHIRMGDRHINNTNMRTWCEHHTVLNAHGEKTWTHATTNSMQWYDMGCNRRQPFGAVQLQQVVDAAVFLSNEEYSQRKGEKIKDVLVMTDDYHWLHRALVEYQKSPEYRSDIRLHIFPTHIHNVHASRMTLQATAEWWSAIAAARQCVGFVAHYASAASYAMYLAMCFQHGAHYLHCPPWYFFD